MVLTYFYNADQLMAKRDEIKKVFFYRICGTGMGASACLLKQRGFHVEGADSKFFPPMSDYLKSTGIPCYTLENISDNFLKEFDLIVVGNVVPRDSEAARRLESLGVPFCSFPSALGGLMLYDQNVVGIAGTHGKTTTTYFAMQVFRGLGVEPGYLIGGVLEGRPSSHKGDGSYFFIESDEYDSAYFEKIAKLRMYTIDHLILTSLEYDHADIYDSLDEIKDQFRAILPEVGKTFIGNTDYQAVKELQEEYRRQNHPEGKIYEFGLESPYGPRILKSDGPVTSFELRLDNQWEKFETSVTGRHNILNLSTVILFAFREGFDLADIKKAVKDLGLVKRRQELRGFYGESLVIDDFAHHPKAVAMTIEAIREKYPLQKVHVIMEPHSATARSSIFQHEFEDALSDADSLYLTKLHRPTTAKNRDDLDIDAIISLHRKKGRPGAIIEGLDNLVKVLDGFKNSRDIILVLSNGTCLGLWESQFVKELTPIAQHGT